MSDFPKMIFRAGGSYGPKGAQYSVGNAKSADHFKVLKKLGWCASKEEALGLNVSDIAVDEVPASQVEENAPPTREELEAKAKELGVRFNSRTKDSTILERIEEALADDNQAPIN